MRGFLLFVGWSSLVGSIGDAVLGLYALWVVSSVSTVELSLSLDNFLKHYVEFIYWVKHLAFYVMPNRLAKWLFDVPALAYFPIRIVVSVIIGWWALRKAEELKVNARNPSI